MSNRIVKCIKLNKELPGLDSPPVPGELGKKVFESVSKEAWDEFLEYFKMVVNEYHLDLTSPHSDHILEQKIGEYFFSCDVKMPDGFVPPVKN